MRAKAAKHVVAVLALDGLSMFEFSVACDVFGDEVLAASGYELLVCGPTRSVSTDRGLRVSVPHRLAELDRARTVIVTPTESREQPSARVLESLRRAHQRGARIVSVCTGAFVLAAAGLLDGRRATTHWQNCAELASRYPTVDVDPDTLYIDDGDVLTSAGSAASIDLCLHLVRNDLGAAVAADIARGLVVPPYRDGGQAQFIRTPLPRDDVDDLFTDTLACVQEHLGDPITVAELARRSAMSPRTFARRFVDTTGTTPYRWLLRQRIALAQQLLEETGEPVESIAARSGFVSAVNLRKHFARVVGCSPAAYRNRFAAPSAHYP